MEPEAIYRSGAELNNADRQVRVVQMAQGGCAQTRQQRRGRAPLVAEKDANVVEAKGGLELDASARRYITQRVELPSL